MTAIIESPEALALRVLRDHDGPVLGRYHLGVAVVRARDEQIGAAIFALATEWETKAPLTSGGYVAGLRELAAMRVEALGREMARWEAKRKATKP